MTAAVHVHQAVKSFGVQRVLDGIEFTAESGAVTAIIGPSGSGKSTLLRAINHLEQLDSGYVTVHNELVGVRVHRGGSRNCPSAPSCGSGRGSASSSRTSTCSRT